MEFVYSEVTAGSIRQRREKSTMTLRKFLHDESGATAIEYGLIAACIAVAIITAANALGGSLSGIFTDVKTELDKH
jgi:pilus assembly protein Flp/PilA